MIGGDTGEEARSKKETGELKERKIGDEKERASLNHNDPIAAKRKRNLSSCPWREGPDAAQTRKPQRGPTSSSSEVQWLATTTMTRRVRGSVAKTLRDNRGGLQGQEKLRDTPQKTSTPNHKKKTSHWDEKRRTRGKSGVDKNHHRASNTRSTGQ